MGVIAGRIYATVLVIPLLAGCTNPTPEEEAPAFSSPECDDTGFCEYLFELEGIGYSLSCAGVRPDAVTDQVLGTGVLDGIEVTVNLISGVDPAVTVAVSLPGGDCDDDGEIVISPWRMTIPGRPDERALLNAVCLVGALTPAEAELNGCP